MKFLHTNYYYSRLVLAGVCLCVVQAMSGADKGDLLLNILAPVAVEPPEPAPEPEQTVEVVVESDSEVPERVSIGLDAVLRRIEELVSHQMDTDSQVQLTCTGRWAPVRINDDQLWDIVLHNDFSPDTRGRWYASFTVEADGEPVVTRQLRLEAALYKEMWMARQRLLRGDLPSEPTVQPVLRNVYLERGNPIPASQDLSGYEVVSVVAEGHLLTWKDLRRRPSVRKGNIVEVIVKEGGLTVTMRARSLEDGLIGDDVIVKNLSSHRELIGTVIGPDQIQFHP